MARSARRPSTVAPALVLTLAVLLAAGACGGGDTHSSSPTTVAKRTGAVDVLYDSSLDALMRGAVAAGFHNETGYSFEGLSAPSATLASQVAARPRFGDVLVAEGVTADESLMGAAGGGRITWYASFASSGTDTYTVTVLDDPPDPAAAQALVRYLLGTSASANLRSAGLRELAKYVVVGTGVPEGLQKLLGQ